LANSIRTVNWTLNNCRGLKTIKLTPHGSCFANVRVNQAALSSGGVLGSTYSYSNGVHSWRNSNVSASAATFTATMNNTGSNCSLTLSVE
jgi:hypothetical protein